VYATVYATVYGSVHTVYALSYMQHLRNKQVRPITCSMLYICDVLVWRGYSLVECAAEFRSFWLSTKLAEDPEATQVCMLESLTVYVKSMPAYTHNGHFSCLLCLELARTIYTRCIYGIFGRETTSYTVMYGAYIRFWPTLLMSLTDLAEDPQAVQIGLCP